MARKNVLTPYRLVTDGDLTANFTSDATDVTYTDNIGIQVSWTGDTEGEFTVQASVNGTDWQDLDLGTNPTAAGVAGGFLVSLNQLPYKSVRLNYTYSAGTTGVLQVWIMYKQVGG